MRETESLVEMLNSASYRCIFQTDVNPTPIPRAIPTLTSISQTSTKNQTIDKVRDFLMGCVKQAASGHSTVQMDMPNWCRPLVQRTVIGGFCASGIRGLAVTDILYDCITVIVELLSILQGRKQSDTIKP
jgi:hypothetical protein